MTRETTRPAGPYGGRWAALALLLSAVFMDMVDNQIVNIALPTIQRDLGAQPSALLIVKANRWKEDRNVAGEQERRDVPTGGTL